MTASSPSERDYAQASGDTPAEEYLDVPAHAGDVFDPPTRGRPGRPEGQDDESELYSQTSGDTPAGVYLEE